MIGLNDNLYQSSNAAMSNLPWLRPLIRNALLTLQRHRRNITCRKEQVTEPALFGEILDSPLIPM
jgi:hypothetical protein